MGFRSTFASFSLEGFNPDPLADCILQRRMSSLNNWCWPSWRSGTPSTSRTPAWPVRHRRRDPPWQLLHALSTPPFRSPSHIVQQSLQPSLIPGDGRDNDVW